MEYVKVCGIKNYNDAKLCIEQGADAIGFIYNVPSSPRNLEKNQLLSLLNEINNQSSTVLVTKTNNLEEIQEYDKEFNPTFIQIHSNLDIKELNNLSKDLKKKMIVALSVEKTNKKSIISLINDNHSLFFAYLIDSSEGHGNQFNFKIIEDILKNTNTKRIILAGGININNVEKIIKKIKPYGIDLSSSLESENGVKDSNKIKNFLQKINLIKKSIKK
ncbi:MAG: phosphoribosylanthranilate isomerase [Candidatus Lokiarchaeota archaeon]|nr:phosphoribosylanthranilate isomerase [Candidatus Lokiarchaeota archaeon]